MPWEWNGQPGNIFGQDMGDGKNWSWAWGLRLWGTVFPQLMYKQMWSKSEIAEMISKIIITNNNNDDGDDVDNHDTDDDVC